MVEFALVIPILCVVLFGVIAVRHLDKNYVTLTDAARIGARKAAVSRHQADPVAVTVARRGSASGYLDRHELGVTVTAALGSTART